MNILYGMLCLQLWVGSSVAFDFIAGANGRLPAGWSFIGGNLGLATPVPAGKGLE